MQTQYSTKQKSIPILAMHRQVGAVKGKVFNKRVQGSRHFLRKPPAIALDVASLEAARAAGADEVAIRDQESGLTYRASIETVLEHGFTFDRGFGEQVGLEFKWWILKRKSVEDAPQQLSFA